MSVATIVFFMTIILAKRFLVMRIIFNTHNIFVATTMRIAVLVRN